MANDSEHCSNYKLSRETKEPHGVCVAQYLESYAASVPQCGKQFNAFSKIFSSNLIISILHLDRLTVRYTL